MIQYFCAKGFGVLTMNSFVSLSYVAVVSICTALFPYPSSVRPKHPTSSRVSIPYKRSVIENITRLHVNETGLITGNLYFTYFTFEQIDIPNINTALVLTIVFYNQARTMLNTGIDNFTSDDRFAK